MDAPTYREEVYDTFTGADGDLDGRIAHALDVGTEYLDVPVGFLTRIEDGTQRIVRVSGEHETIRPGATCPLDDAYCRRTVELEGSLAVQDAVASPEVSSSAVETFGLGTYIGARVVVDGETHGTVCFADEEPREEPFGEAEEVFVELLARLIGQAFERRNHERELRERNERLEREKKRFEGIAETSFDILFRIGTDGKFTNVSPAVERVLGYAPEELEGYPFAEFIAPGSVDDALAAYETVAGGGSVEAVDLDFRDADGETVIIEVNAAPIEDAGETVGVQGVGRDVTARREREQELRLKNRAMDEARIGISISDSEGEDNPLVYVNRGFERVTGYAPDEAMGHNCRFLQGEATGDEPIDELREAIIAEEPVSVEAVNYRKSGAPFWNHIRVTPIENEAGEVRHYLGFQDDITERKRSEQLIALLNRVLRHNLRNDMNAVLGFSDLIQNAGNDRAAEYGKRIEESATELVALSEKARELERYARRERIPERLDPGELAASVAGEYAESYPEATIETAVRTERDVCAGPELERALSELVENALKHAPDPDPRVVVGAEDNGDDVEITVSDDGDGIDDVETTVISRGQETALEHGSGLGLWLVNWVVTRYGGSFQIAGGEGTVARIRLPALGEGETAESVARRPTVLFR
jgi:PAS domain S-box-containing protein